MDHRVLDDALVSSAFRRVRMAVAHCWPWLVLPLPLVFLTACGALTYVGQTETERFVFIMMMCLSIICFAWTCVIIFFTLEGYEPLDAKELTELTEIAEKVPEVAPWIARGLESGQTLRRRDLTVAREAVARASVEASIASAADARIHALNGLQTAVSRAMESHVP